MRKNTTVFGNFVCKFGDKLNLLDVVPEIVFPAFSDHELSRKYGDTEYVMHDVTFVDIGDTKDPNPAITGYFIKKTKLTRTQIFVEGVGITHDETSIDSAPSAFFVLLLSNHRLIYFADSRDAPDMKAFAATIRSFIRVKHEEYVRNIYNERVSQGVKVTLKGVREEIPDPTVHVVPLTSPSSIDAFISRYDVLRVLKFRLLKPNDEETDGGKVYEDIRNKGKKLNTQDTSLVYHNDEGLDKDQASIEIEEATKSGNQITYLSGTDSHGNRVTGNNENFQLSIELSEVPPYRSELVRALSDKFNALVDSGSIQPGKPANDPMPRLRRIMSVLLP